MSGAALTVSGAVTDGDNNGVIANFNLGGPFQLPRTRAVSRRHLRRARRHRLERQLLRGRRRLHPRHVGSGRPMVLADVTLYGQGGVQTNLSNGDDGGNYNAWFVRVRRPLLPQRESARSRRRPSIRKAGRTARTFALPSDRRSVRPSGPSAWRQYENAAIRMGRRHREEV